MSEEDKEVKVNVDQPDIPPFHGMEKIKHIDDKSDEFRVKAVDVSKVSRNSFVKEPTLWDIRERLLEDHMGLDIEEKGCCSKCGENKFAICKSCQSS